MSRALVYVLSRDSTSIAKIKQASEFIFCTFGTSEELDSAAERRSPDLFLFDFDGDIHSCDGYTPVLGIASSLELIPHEHVNGFMLKSADIDSFRYWMLRHEKLIEDRASLENNLSEAFKTAMSAMSSMGEHGVVMRFLTEAFALRDFQMLAGRLLDACGEYDLMGGVQIRVPGQSYLATRGDARADAEVFANMRDLGRLLEFRQRVVVNFENVSILISNMPEDPGTRGRMRDNLAILAEGANERVRSLVLESDNANIQKGIRRALIEVRTAISEIRALSCKHPQSLERLVNRGIDDIQIAMVHLALTPEQENAMIGPMIEIRELLQEQSSESIDSILAGIVSTLETIASPHSD